MNHRLCRFRGLLLASVCFGPFAGNPVGAADCNANGTEDSTEISEGGAKDCNHNGIPDECDLRPTGSGFQLAPQLMVQNRPIGGLAADLDDDGATDLITFHGFGHSFNLFWSLGNGEFQPPFLFSAGFATSGVALDFDGDGDRDLAVLSRGNPFDSTIGAVLLFENRGRRIFRQAATAPAGMGANSLAAFDLDGDLLTDLAVANGGREELTFGNVTLIRNRGEWQFESRSVPGQWERPAGIAAGDLDGDGRPDLAVADRASGSMAVLLNDRRGGLGEAVRYPTAGNPGPLVLADLDGDRDQDLAAADDLGYRLLLSMNDGAGGFLDGLALGLSSSPHQLVALDLDLDGRTDLAVVGSLNGLPSSEVTVLWNRTGGFASRTSLQSGRIMDRARSLVGADLNGDRAPDLATFEEEGMYGSLFLSEGSERLRGIVRHPAPWNPQALAVSDLDGDARPEIVVASQGSAQGRIGFLKGTENGGFLPVEELGKAGRYRDLLSADLDGDGDMDLAAVNEVPRGLAIHFNDGASGFSEGPAVPVDSFPGKLASGDLDGDGTPDLVLAAYYEDGSVTNANALVFLARDAAGFAAQPPLSTAGWTYRGYPLTIGVGDLDGDGNLDLVLAEPGGDSFPLQRLHLFYRQEEGTWSAPRALDTVKLPVDLGIADLNLDGHQDLVAAGRAGAVGVHLSEDGRDYPVTELPMTAFPENVLLRDVTGDGLPDLAVLQTGNSEGTMVRHAGLHLLENDGSGRFQPPQELGITAFPRVRSVAAGDLNGDSLPDLALTTGSEGIATLFNRGSVTSRDCDRDGAPDECSTLSGQAPDCNRNSVPDSCEIASATSADCNSNGVPDECDLRDGTLRDANQDGIPDGCEPVPVFHRGDVNRDGDGNLSDAVFLFSYLFLGTFPPGCLESADVDNSGDLNITDPLVLLIHLFLDGPPPAAPGLPPALCGPDPDPPGSPGQLSCLRYESCR